MRRSEKSQRNKIHIPVATATEALIDASDSIGQWIVRGCSRLRFCGHGDNLAETKKFDRRDDEFAAHSEKCEPNQCSFILRICPLLPQNSCFLRQIDRPFRKEQEALSVSSCRCRTRIMPTRIMTGWVAVVGVHVHALFLEFFDAHQL